MPNMPRTVAHVRKRECEWKTFSRWNIAKKALCYFSVMRGPHRRHSFIVSLAIGTRLLLKMWVCIRLWCSRDTLLSSANSSYRTNMLHFSPSVNYLFGAGEEGDRSQRCSLSLCWKNGSNCLKSNCGSLLKYQAECLLHIGRSKEEEKKVRWVALWKDALWCRFSSSSFPKLIFYYDLLFLSTLMPDRQQYCTTLSRNTP